MQRFTEYIEKALYVFGVASNTFRIAEYIWLTSKKDKLSLSFPASDFFFFARTA